MKVKLERIIERLTELRDQANDDELMDEIDNALIHLDAASDRLIQMEEEEEEDDESLDEDDDEDEDEPINCPWEKASAIALADELIAACEESDASQCRRHRQKQQP